MIPIQQLIDNELSKERSTPRKRSGKFSPSSFGRCIRAQIWNRADVQKTDEVEERMLRVFKVGNLFHEFIQKVIVNNDPTIKTEVKVEEEDVIGFADIVSAESVTDIKTVHSGAFHYMKEDISESKKPNILQVMYYARMLNKDKATLCFVSKDDLCIKEVAFILNERWQKELDEELKTLRFWWDLYQKSAPAIWPKAEPRAYCDKNGKSKECAFCSYKTLCKETENAK